MEFCFVVRRALLVALLLVAALAAAPGAHAQLPASFPATGDILENTLVVRKQPSLGARVVMRIRAVRPDRRLTIVHAIAGRTDAAGREWVKLVLQKRPNNSRGWALAESIALTPMAK